MKPGDKVYFAFIGPGKVVTIEEYFFFGHDYVSDCYNFKCSKSRTSLTERVLVEDYKGDPYKRPFRPDELSDTPIGALQKLLSYYRNSLPKLLSQKAEIEADIVAAQEGDVLLQQFMEELIRGKKEPTITKVDRPKYGMENT